ncbi:MAG: hypothetical protein II961_05785 [Candidatus Riflebacteria bacterium]|nr:hypothetical protein [Candidatus Riflebacteria bacterium]
MRKKVIFILLLSALALSEPAFAVSKQSENALSAFRRYEPEFSNSLRSLQELKRKQDNLMEDESGASSSEILLQAENLMSKVEDRYDLMEDLYNNTLSKNPADQIELRDGFNRLDDLYRKVRDYYTDNYTFKEKEKVEVKETEQDKKKENLSEAEKAETPYELNPITASDEYSNVISAEDQKNEKVKLTGNLKFEFRDSDEKHENVGETVPNDLTSGRLRLTYDMENNRQLYLEEKYLTRERNEKVKENHLTLSFNKKNDDNSAITLRDKLQHVKYPDNSNKNYRVNLFEALYAKNWKNRDMELSLGLKTKAYPNNSRSDYNEYIASAQESWMNNNSTKYIEFTSDIVKYKNVDNLDYKNFNLYTEMTKYFTGNNADLSISNTYDRRIYENESLISFRTSYYDDYFQFGYKLPVNNKVNYNLKADYSKRSYASDEPRGYAELDIFNGFSIKTDDRTYVNADYRYKYNDENTREYAHKNNIIHIGWVRSINKDYKIKFDDTYHQRNSVTNEALDFDQNDFVADLSWNLKNNYKLSWTTEHFIRRYDNISMNFADYRYIQSGFNLSFYKRKCYDWQISQRWRKLEFRNLGGAPSDWDGRMQPVTEVKYNRWLKDDLKLTINGTLEKTYYSEFNNASQEMEYNFADRVYNKQVYASLEYIF